MEIVTKKKLMLFSGTTHPALAEEICAQLEVPRAAAELGPDKIRVNCVAPGVIWTDFHSTMTPETRKNNLENRIPLHREGNPQQVATVIREMVTNDYITGETYVIDGGLTMRIC